MGSRNRRLSLESLETRENPANSLSITGGATVGIDTSSAVAGVITIQTTLPGALLSKTDLFNALNTAGVNEVVVTTSVASGGVDGADSGIIIWNSAAGSLDIDGLAAGKTLTFRPDASGAAPAIRFTGAGLFSPIVDSNSGTIEDLTLQLSGEVQVGTDASLQALGRLIVNGNIAGGGNDLTIAADQEFELNGNIAGVDAFTLNHGLLNLALPNTIEAATFVVNNDGSILAGDGTITANVSLNPFTNMTFAGVINGSLSALRAKVSPGGDGTVGTLIVNGSMDIDDQSTVFMNLGVGIDLIVVSGNVELTTVAGNENTLTGIGPLPGANSNSLISFGGTLTGTFGNIPNGLPAILGTEAVTASYGTGPNGALSVVPVPGVRSIIRQDFDGTMITIKLSGPGELALVTDAFFQKSLVLRNTTAKSNLTIGTKAVFGSSGQTRFFSIAVNGPIGAINAPKTSVDFGGIKILGTAKSIKILDLIGVPRFATAVIDIGGAAANRTTIQARDMNFASVTSVGQIQQLKTRGDFTGFLSAAAFGSIAIGDDFTADIATPGSIKSVAAKSTVSDSGGLWQVGGSIGKLSAGNIEELQVTANFLGSITVQGNTKILEAGTIVNSNFTLLGNSGVKTKFVGLRSVNARGAITNTTFDVREGNVGSVTAARFINSNLWVDYTPGATFDAASAFGASKFKLGSFRTKAPSFIDPSGAKIFSFADSQIAASSIGNVNLMSLNTDSPTNTPFGIKFADTLKSLKTVKESSNAAIPLKTKLTANAAALADDFFVLDV